MPKRVLQLNHFSVKEYLVSSTVREGKTARFSLQEGLVHESIAECCLAYLPDVDIDIQYTGMNQHVRSPVIPPKTGLNMRAMRASIAARLSKVPRLLSSEQEKFQRWLRLYNEDVRGSPMADHKRKTALLYGICGVPSLAGALINGGADVNARGGEFDSALKAASYRGHLEVVQQLLEKGADVHAHAGDYGSALQVASGGGHVEVVQQLQEKGAAVNAQGGENGSVLQAASALGHLAVVQKLLDHGVAATAQTAARGFALPDLPY